MGRNIALEDLNNFKMNVEGYISCMTPVNHSKGRTFELDTLASCGGIKDFHSLDKILLLLRQTVLSETCLVALKMQNHFGMLRFTRMIDASQTVQDIVKLPSSIYFCEPPQIFNIAVATLSDASRCGYHKICDQKGVTTGLRV